MVTRVLLTKYLTCILATITLTSAETFITKNTTWSNDITLSESIIIQKNITLTIKEGVNISIENVDLNNDDHGDIEISVLGSINIEGSHENMVSIKPIQYSLDKNYWSGVTIHESNIPSSIEFLEISNAQTGLQIRSGFRARGLLIENCGSSGINIESVSNDSIDLKNIEISNSDGVGLFIKKGNVFIDWAHVHHCQGVGIVNNNLGVVDILNTKIINNKDNGIDNYGNMTSYNLTVKENRHGVVISSGITVVTKGNISDNRSNGLLIGGSSNVNIESSTIKNNQGYGLELTDWEQEDYFSFWTKGESPAVKIGRSNFIDNHKTTVLDEHRYENIWKNWEGVEYTGDGWVENWEEKIYREVPFGRIGWIGFQYNSNNGGSEFSWQPCTGNSVWSPIFEIKNSRYQTLTYLPAPFQCSWNPLAGKHSNTWIEYSDYTGSIDNTDSYADWSITKENLLSSNRYLLRQYFNYAYIPGQDSGFVVKPEVNDFRLSFYHGGKEISSYSDNSEIELADNFWGSQTGESSMINPYGNTDINADDKLSSIVKDGTSVLENKNKIDIYTPAKGLAYQEIKMLDINWRTIGWMPMVDIFLSVDDGITWESIGSDISNDGEFRWWNNLIVGEKFYIKIADSYDLNSSTVIGPCDVIENTTPIIDLSTDNLNFITGKNEIDFSIKNIGGGLLKWSLVSDAGWIKLSRTSGSTKKESSCTAKVKRTGLKDGKYQGTIMVSSNSEEKEIDVDMIVAMPSLYVDAKYLRFDSTKNSQTFNIKNFGGGTMSWEIQSDVHWLVINPDRGSIRSGTSVSLTVDRSRLRLGNNEAMLKLKSNVGEKTIDVSAYRTKSFVDDTVSIDFSPWHWMYDHIVY